MPRHVSYLKPTLSLRWITKRGDQWRDQKAKMLLQAGSLPTERCLLTTMFSVVLCLLLCLLVLHMFYDSAVLIKFVML